MNLQAQGPFWACSGSQLRKAPGLRDKRTGLVNGHCQSHSILKERASFEGSAAFVGSSVLDVDGDVNTPSATILPNRIRSGRVRPPESKLRVCIPPLLALLELFAKIELLVLGFPASS